MLDGEDGERDRGLGVHDQIPDVVRIVVIPVHQPLQDALLFFGTAHGQRLGLRERQFAALQCLFNSIRQIDQSQAPFEGGNAEPRLRRDVR